jgi:hypothetical protein
MVEPVGSSDNIDGIDISIFKLFMTVDQYCIWLKDSMWAGFAVGTFLLMKDQIRYKLITCGHTFRPDIISTKVHIARLFE